MKAAMIVTAAALVLSAVAGGCSGSPGARPSPVPTGIPALENPPFRPVESADPATESPEALTKPLSPRKLADAAASSPARLDGERFVLLAVQALTDVRPGHRGRDVVRALAGDLPTDDRAYLIDDIDGQQQIGTERGLCTTCDLWLRSRVWNADGRPEIEAEVAAVVTSSATGNEFWYRQTVVVRWDEERWLLDDYRGASMGPDHRTLDAAERATVLPGQGWRRIPPAG